MSLRPLLESLSGAETATGAGDMGVSTAGAGGAVERVDGGGVDAEGRRGGKRIRLGAKERGAGRARRRRLGCEVRLE